MNPQDESTVLTLSYASRSSSEGIVWFTGYLFQLKQPDCRRRQVSQNTMFICDSYDLEHARMKLETSRRNDQWWILLHLVIRCVGMKIILRVLQVAKCLKTIRSAARRRNIDFIWMNFVCKQPYKEGSTASTWGDVNKFLEFRPN